MQNRLRSPNRLIRTYAAPAGYADKRTGTGQALPFTVTLEPHSPFSGITVVVRPNQIRHVYYSSGSYKPDRFVISKTFKPMRAVRFV